MKPRSASHRRGLCRFEFRCGERDLRFCKNRIAPTRLDVMEFKGDHTDVPAAGTSTQPLSRNPKRTGSLE